MIELVGVPFDLCGKRAGSRLGPAALRLAHLRQELEGIGERVMDGGDVAVGGEGTTRPGGLRDFEALRDTLRTLGDRVERAVAAGRMPVVLGGDHTIAAGSAAVAARRGAAVLWIDAHADVNTPGSSDSGNLHGMPVAALWGLASGVEGLPDDQWRALLDDLGPERLLPGRTAWYGLRDVDAEEGRRVGAGLPITMHDVDRQGVPATVERWDAWMRASGATDLWISFDVDCLDPVLAPGTGTAVRGGLTYREAHLLAELLHEKIAVGPYRLLGVDVVETNPLVDRHNETAVMAVEWILSLMGKTVLGGRGR